jgi:hypothetical protein
MGTLHCYYRRHTSTEHAEGWSIVSQFRWRVGSHDKTHILYFWCLGGCILKKPYQSMISFRLTCFFQFRVLLGTFITILDVISYTTEKLLRRLLSKQNVCLELAKLLLNLIAQALIKVHDFRLGCRPWQCVSVLPRPSLMLERRRRCPRWKARRLLVLHVAGGSA